MQIMSVPNLHTCERIAINSRNGRSVWLGCSGRQADVLSHVWTRSSLRSHELQTKRIVRCQAAEEVVRVRNVLLAEK